MTVYTTLTPLATCRTVPVAGEVANYYYFSTVVTLLPGLAVHSIHTKSALTNAVQSVTGPFKFVNGRANHTHKLHADWSISVKLVYQNSQTYRNSLGLVHTVSFPKIFYGPTSSFDRYQQIVRFEFFDLIAVWPKITSETGLHSFHFKAFQVDGIAIRKRRKDSQ